MTRLPRVAAVIVTLAAAALATTAQGEARAATPPTSRGVPTGPTHTHLIVHITGCDRCTVALQHAVTGHQNVWTSAAQRIGSDHRASFRVRNSRTHGLSFLLDAPWEGDTGGVPNLVTRYAGHPIDSLVSRDAARHARHAEGCWAGTTAGGRVRLDFHVARVPAKTLTGDPTHVPLAYATHSMSSWKPMVKTWKGTIGNQDAFWCTKPPTTRLTLQTPGCDGCQIQVMNGANRFENDWGSPVKTVTGDSVTFRIPRPLTRGISATVLGPWEGATGYATMIAWRYAGHHVGDAVTFKDARSQTRGTPCWGGTSSKDLTIPLTIRKVTVPGTTGPAAGTIAFADVTQSWLKPMYDAGKGVIGSQSVIACDK